MLVFTIRYAVRSGTRSTELVARDEHDALMRFHRKFNNARVIAITLSI